MTDVYLKKGRDASLRRRHPWIFSGAIERIDGSVQAGDVVRVFSHEGKVLGTGGYSPESQIRIRLYSFEEAGIDRQFFARRIEAAAAKRRDLADDPERDAYRLVFGESDRLPGLIVDRYDDYLVCQFQFAGLDRFKTDLVEALAEITGCHGIFERSDNFSRKKEGLNPAEGVLWGQEPPAALLIREYGMQLEVDLQHGQKTGFYLDQAENRRLIRSYCEGKEVLNCFSYTGAFSVAALLAGATQVTSVDSSAVALQIAGRNLEYNGLDPGRHSAVDARVGNQLREWQKQDRRFDLVILDPPKFAEQRSQVMKASRAYKDLALQAVKLIRPGGLLVTFSCSGAIEPGLFQKITADALLDAGREGEVIQYLHQAADHPVALAFPESQYLKGLVCRIND